MSETVYELDVRLREIEPPIWRTIEVPGSSTLEDLHFAIQVAMGWTNSHLHSFQIKDTGYGMVEVEGNELELEDEREFRIADLAKTGDVFRYEYDFGDGWEHAITVKKVTSSSKAVHPRCLAGKRACPPEDCGGPHGYAQLLESLADPKHPEHESSTKWAQGFEPERFPMPKKGLALRPSMEELRALADGDGGIDDEVGLPRAFVDEILALDPMRRASLVALITASLVEDLGEALAIIDKLAAAKPTKRGHSPRRSR